jgi:hypothetical protein
MLSDMDGDNQLSKRELMVAMHLCDMKLKGIEVPPVLPPAVLASLPNNAQGNDVYTDKAVN